MPRNRFILRELAAFVVLAAMAMVLCRCTPPRAPTAAPATYGAELELCLQSTSTCQGYLACRHRVQVRYGRPVTGRCL